MTPSRPPISASHGSASHTGSVLPAWMAFCFLCSGAAGLMYEVVWSKQLSYLLGGSLQSVATVVAAFLGGLALGARLLGVRVANRPGLTRSYAALEAGVALLGVAMLPLLRSLDGPVGQLYRAFGGESMAFALARVALLMVVLVPPAALMGATLPVLVARCERGVLGSALARLYAINTLGAVTGSVLAGFWLMPAWGLTATTFVAAALNLTAALVAWIVAARERRDVPVPTQVADQPHSLLSPGARTWFAGLFALSGCAALLLQLAWVRLFGLVLGSSVYSFASVLGVYLLGIALGSAAIAPFLARREVSTWWFALLQFGIGIASAIGIRAYAGLPHAMLELGERTGASWGGLIAGELAMVAAILFVPCLLLGAAFPLATRLLQRGAAGAATGAAFAVNTLGTIAGSLATGFLLLPALGVQGVVLLACGISVLVGVATLALQAGPRIRRPPLATAIVLFAAAVIACLTTPRWNPLLMSLGMFRPVSAHNLLQSFRASGATGDPTRTLAASQHVLYYRDGINASVLVASDEGRRRLWMRVGGKVDAGTGDMLTQVLLGLIPAAMADTGAHTLVVGHGSGVTAAAALAAGAGATDIVELEPAVITGSRFFHEPREDPLNDRRVTVHLEDARTRLAHGGGQYGVVISEPSNPWIAGVNNLFTVDFYRRVRARLRPDGVFCQWLQLYELSPRTFKSLLASFLTVFPDAHLFCLWDASDAVLVAAPPGRMLSLARLAAPALAFQYERARLASPNQIAAYYVCSGAALRAMAAGGQLNTDERPFVEYQAPRDMIEVGRTYGSNDPRVTSLFALPLQPPGGSPLADWPAESVVEWRARQKLRTTNATETAALLAEIREAGFAPLAARLATEGRTQDVDALAEARARLARGDADGAGAIARQVLARATGSERLEPLLLLGMSQIGAQRHIEALGSFREAEGVAPADARAYSYEARVRLGSGDAAGARLALERGLARVPNDQTLKAALLALTDERKH